MHIKKYTLKYEMSRRHANVRRLARDHTKQWDGQAVEVEHSILKASCEDIMYTVPTPLRRYAEWLCDKGNICFRNPLPFLARDRR